MSGEWAELFGPNGKRILLHHDEDADVFTSVQFATREEIARMNREAAVRASDAHPDREWIELPCGCRFTDDESGPFMFDPHDFTCEMYQYTLAESARQGKPIEIREEHP